MKLLTPQKYSCLSTFCLMHGVILPVPRDDWRLIAEPFTGEINGIPTLRGTAVATNGIMLAIETESNAIVYGHLEYFVPDEEINVQTAVAKQTSKSQTPQTKSKQVLLDYLV